MSLNLKSLINKLDDATRSAFEAAAGLCVSRTHYDIEVEHYLMKAIDSSDNDIAFILKQYGVDKSRLTTELQRSLDRLKTGNARSPAFSPQLVKMLTEAWTIATIEYDANQIRTGHTLLALLTNDELVRLIRDISKELQLIPVEALRNGFLHRHGKVARRTLRRRHRALQQPREARSATARRLRQNAASRPVHRKPD